MNKQNIELVLDVQEDLSSSEAVECSVYAANLTEMVNTANPADLLPTGEIIRTCQEFNKNMFKRGTDVRLLWKLIY